ncbi:pectate lyase, partial [Streptomyces sp. SID5926]|nr:pectate lyase [Streptomyces sp. SID5926]
MSTQRWHGHATRHVTRRTAALVGCTALVLSLTVATAEARPGHHHPRDTARQTLPAGDGWASHGTG